MGVRTPSFYCNSASPCLDSWGESPNPFLTLFFRACTMGSNNAVCTCLPRIEKIKAQSGNFPPQEKSSHHEQVMSKPVGAAILGSVATPGKCQDAWENVPRLRDATGIHTGVRQASEVVFVEMGISGKGKPRRTFQRMKDCTRVSRRPKGSLLLFLLQTRLEEGLTAGDGPANNA